MAIARALQATPTRAVPVVDGERIPTRTELAGACPVGDVERMVLTRVDGKRSIGDISALLGLATNEGAMIVQRLVELGAVSLADATEVDDAWETPSGTMPTVPPPNKRHDHEP